jgi:hypothetical protein
LHRLTRKSQSSGLIARMVTPSASSRRIPSRADSDFEAYTCGERAPW